MAPKATNRRLPRPTSGASSEGETYRNVHEMWQRELSEKTEDNHLAWYSKALSYWRSSEATVDGVLGGYGAVSPQDLEETAAFLTDVRNGIASFGQGRCVDCGCGIGRVTNAVLVRLFDQVDLVEPCGNLLEKAKADIPPQKLGDVWPQPLQEFTPTPGAYDCIFIQWATLYLTDEDLINCWKRCQAGLKEGGIIFLKENITSDNRFHIDKVDSSITRSDRQYKESFDQAGLKVLAERDQNNWPSELFPVKMYVLR